MYHFADISQRDSDARTDCLPTTRCRDPTNPVGLGASYRSVHEILNVFVLVIHLYGSICVCILCVSGVAFGIVYSFSLTAA